MVSGAKRQSAPGAKTQSVPGERRQLVPGAEKQSVPGNRSPITRATNTIPALMASTKRVPPSISKLIMKTLETTKS